MDNNKKEREIETEYTDKRKENLCSWVLVIYYNVHFYILLKGLEDQIKFSYLQKRIDAGERMCMKDIYLWCNRQNIDLVTKFKYLKRLPITANIWNYYCYLHAKHDYQKKFK